jgi:hypothetical protein
MCTTLTSEDDVAAVIRRLQERRKGSLKTTLNEALRLGLKQIEAAATVTSSATDDGRAQYVLDRRQLEYCAAAIATDCRVRATAQRGPVKITRAVSKQDRMWSGTVWSALKIVEHCLLSTLSVFPCQDWGSARTADDKPLGELCYGSRRSEIW